MNPRIELITSKQNQRIKNILGLQKHSQRKEQGLFVLEGIKEFEKAMVSGYVIDSVFICNEFIESNLKNRILDTLRSTHLFEVNADVYNKVAYRENSGGVIALVRPKNHSIDKLKVGSNPLILVIEGVEKPGNIGAIYRTADAAGIEAVIICDPGTDFYNPNAVRASLGCIFTIPTAICSNQQAIEWLNSNNVKIFTSYLQAAVPYHTVDFTKPSAIVMGTEATGVSPDWVKAAHKNIIIPMRGKADSMNVSTATAVLVFEACRQRGFQ